MRNKAARSPKRALAVIGRIVAAARQSAEGIWRKLTKPIRKAVKRTRKSARRITRDMTKFRRIIKRGWRDRKKSRSKAPRTTAAPAETAALAIPMLVSGLLFALICIPWAIWLARHSGNDPLPTILLLQTPIELPADFWRSLIPDFRRPGGTLLALSIGGLYGLIGVVGGIILLAGGLVRLVVIANGLFFGYLLTALIFGLSSLGSNDPLGRETVLQVAVLLLTHYLAHGIPILITADSYAREKYTFLFAGIQALFAGWLLTVAFGSESVLFAGATYLTCTFVMMALFERIVIPAYETLVHIAVRYDIVLKDDEHEFSWPSLVATATTQQGAIQMEIWIATMGFVLFPVFVAAICWAWHFL